VNCIGTSKRWLGVGVAAEGGREKGSCCVSIVGGGACVHVRVPSTLNAKMTRRLVDFPTNCLNPNP
jgi:hypothetical protein